MVIFISDDQIRVCPVPNKPVYILSTWSGVTSDLLQKDYHKLETDQHTRTQT